MASNQQYGTFAFGRQVFSNVSSEFRNMFKVVIQLASVIAVIVLYFHKLNPFSKRKTPKQRWNTIELWIKVAVACTPSTF